MPRQRSDDLVRRDGRLPHWQDPAYLLNVANAGPYGPDQSGYKVFRGTGHAATEGWKFHISAYPDNAEALAEILLPLLTRLNVFHKHLELHQLLTRTGVEVGKFIAYYPVSPRNAHTLALAISTELATHGMPHPKGPVIQDEMAFGNTGILYTRYGSYAYRCVKGPPGTNTCSWDPPRGLRPYHNTGRVRPSWIPDLRTDHSNALFPLYDAVRTLRGLPESQVAWVN